jgi:hypothetical protein
MPTRISNHILPREFITAICSAMNVPIDNVVSVGIDVKSTDDYVIVEIRHLADRRILPVIEEAVKKSGE